MRALVTDDLIRAATFFSLAFVVTAVGGVLVGEPRIGVRWGLGLGAGFAAFAYFFITPTAPAEPARPPDVDDAEAEATPRDPPAESPPKE